MHPSEAAIAILRRAAWPPAAVFGAHVTASLAFDAYARWPWLDLPMHLLGGVAIACFFARLLEHRAPVDPRIAALLVFALTCTAAVFWEFAEHLSDLLAGTTSQVGLEDTLLDMFLGIVGGAAYLAGKALARRGTARRTVLP